MKRFTSILLVLIILSSMLVTVSFASDASETAVDENIIEIPEGALAEMPCSTNQESEYRSKSYVFYTEEQAKKKEIPAGYEGYVLKLTGNKEMGVRLDFSSQNIPICNVESITVRVYLNKAITSLRIGPDNDDDWLIKFGIHSAYRLDWTDITFSYDYEDMGMSDGFYTLENKDGNLGSFYLYFGASGTEYMYIDSVTIGIRGEDTTAPVFDCADVTDVNVTAGKKLKFQPVAFDEYENRQCKIQENWDKTPFDEEGLLVKGEYNCTLTASDTAGNTATMTYKLTVRDKDTEAPVIHVNSDTVYAITGTIADFPVDVTDNEDEVTPEIKWTTVMCDSQNRLLAGTHVVEITATDDTGNSSSKTVTVIVADSRPFSDNIIEETLPKTDNTSVIAIVMCCVAAIAVLAAAIVIILSKKKKA